MNFTNAIYKRVADYSGKKNTLGERLRKKRAKYLMEMIVA